jgi:pyruvate formate lyase activating enzyme
MLSLAIVVQPNYDQVLRDSGMDAMTCSITTQDTSSAPSLTGTVFDIKRFALHDGPGIRTTVFFKGCPLTCFWCHNPESQAFEPQLVVDADLCIACQHCASPCPTGAAQPAKLLPHDSSEDCSACGRCISSCSAGARSIIGDRRDIGWLLQEVLSDSVFYDDFTGGVTLSGGEPLAQPELAMRLLKACSDEKIHTAVDTCGYVEPDILLAAAEFTDLFLYDLKHMDDDKHQAITGRSNQLILENARRLDAFGADLRIRIPLIPGVNDDASNLLKTGQFISSLESVRAVHILPFHQGGEKKRSQLGVTTAHQLQPASQESVVRKAELLRPLLSVPVTIGG